MPSGPRRQGREPPPCMTMAPATRILPVGDTPLTVNSAGSGTSPPVPGTVPVLTCDDVAGAPPSAAATAAAHRGIVRARSEGGHGRERDEEEVGGEASEAHQARRIARRRSGWWPVGRKISPDRGGRLRAPARRRRSGPTPRRPAPGTRCPSHLTGHAPARALPGADGIEDAALGAEIGAFLQERLDCSSCHRPLACVRVTSIPPLSERDTTSRKRRASARGHRRRAKQADFACRRDGHDARRPQSEGLETAAAHGVCAGGYRGCGGASSRWVSGGQPQTAKGIAGTS